MRRFPFDVGAVVMLTLLVVPLSARGAASAKTLRRFHDPIIVKTSELFSLADRRTQSYRLYASSSASLTPIPYQFDHRDERGDMVFSATPDSTDFTFDRDDEIVFMAKDSGERMSAATLPPGGDAAVEIEVTDPVDGGRGWAYLVHFAHEPPPRSPVRYATFDNARNQVRAELYAIDYAPGQNYFLAMRLTPEAGGDGEPIADRMSVRVNPTFSLLLTSWSPEFTEDSFTVQIDGVKNGPVRAIRRVRQSLDLGKYFPEVPGGTTYTYYYFSSFSTPSKFSLPWLALKALRAFRFTEVSVLGKHAGGMRYWDAANPGGVRLGTTLEAGVGPLGITIGTC